MTTKSTPKIYAPGFKYRGGKWLLRDWIIDYVPKEGSLYIEPFAGRANLFWLACQVRKFSSYQLNDIRTAPFFNAIKEVDLNTLPGDIHHFEESDAHNGISNKDPLWLVLEPVLYFSGGVAGDTFMRSREYKTVGGRESTHYDQVEYSNRLRISRSILEHYNVSITSVDVLSLPWLEWDESVFVYLDPPYLNAKVDSYSEKDFDPITLGKLMRKTKARWLFSEYEHPLWVRGFGQPIARKSAYVKMAGKRNSGNKSIRVECLWANYKV